MKESTKQTTGYHIVLYIKVNRNPSSLLYIRDSADRPLSSPLHRHPRGERLSQYFLSSLHHGTGPGTSFLWIHLPLKGKAQNKMFWAPWRPRPVFVETLFAMSSLLCFAYQSDMFRSPQFLLLFRFINNLYLSTRTAELGPLPSLPIRVCLAPVLSNFDENVSLTF